MSEVDLPNRIWEYEGFVSLERLALTREQIANRDMPSFAAETKIKDKRYPWYVSHYGHRCWELDALSPVVLRQVVEDRIRLVIDIEEWDRIEVIEAAERESLIEVTEEWHKSLGKRV